jgi:hypothetical protein
MNKKEEKEGWGNFSCAGKLLAESLKKRLHPKVRWVFLK